jgi:beta-lactamase regulating signal transducer with metallopeptidase domain
MGILGWAGPASLSWAEALQAVLDYALKGTLICALAWLLTLLRRHSSAHIRNKIWMFALIALALLPMGSLLAPLWRLPLLPGLGRLALSATGAKGVAGTGPEMGGPDGGGGSLAGQADQVGLGSLGPGPEWALWAVLALVSGACLTLGWILVSRLALRRIVRRARPVSDSWTGLLASLCAELGLRRKVRLLKTPAIRAGIAVGVLRPRVVLPEEAEGWSAQRRRLILSHELAHIQRWDTLAEELAALVSVLYWFNPVVWLALKRFRIERERDCDNAVLRAGARPSDYAMQLMEIAADIGGVARPFWRLEPISQSSNLRDRLLQILDPDVRRVVPSRRAILLLGALLLTLTLPLAALGLWDDGDAIRRPEGVVLSAESRKYWSNPRKRDQSAAYLIEQWLEVSGIDEASRAYEALAARPPDQRGLYIEEGEFNQLGYRLLNAGRSRDAIAVFKMNVLAFPASWNVYDSLGEAYLSTGDLERARANYGRSLELGSENAEKARLALEKIDQMSTGAMPQPEGLRSSMIPASTQ